MRYILYIRPECNVCVKIMKQSLPEDVNIQNIWELEKIPAWIDGTPILADTEDRIIFKGTECLDQLLILREENKMIMEENREKEREEIEEKKENINFLETARPSTPEPINDNVRKSSQNDE